MGSEYYNDFISCEEFYSDEDHHDDDLEDENSED